MWDLMLTNGSAIGRYRGIHPEYARDLNAMFARLPEEYLRKSFLTRFQVR
jgi:hypothetical protein